MIMKKATLAFLLCILALPALAADAPSEPRSDWTTTQTLWDSGHYNYDGSGHVASIGTDVYRYDKVERLRFATAGTIPPQLGQLPANQQEFDYDRYGNLVSIRTVTAQETTLHGFAVNAATNQLGLTCSGTVDGCFTGFYDADTGNQLGRAGDGEYVWDALGMLAELRTSRSERYIYDADGERILVIDDTQGSERYTLRNPADKVAREVSRTRATNTWTLDKDYVYRDSTLIASFSGAQTAPDRHYHVDHLGSTRLVTDASGTRLAIHTYWPFGPEAAGSETDGERLKFTGHERDSSPGTSPGSDLDYMHARYYDANAGRFLSVDPTWESAGLQNPQSWNRYSYVVNNPIRHTDPDGRVCADVLTCTGEGFVVGNVPGAIVGAVAGGLIVYGGSKVNWSDVGEFMLSGGGSSGEMAAETFAQNMANQMAEQQEQASGETGTIYEVPGDATSSGKPYVGRHNKPEPDKTRRSKDGRDRTKAKVIDTYDANNTQEGRVKEQKAIDDRGGVNNLDNKRNEIAPKRVPKETPCTSKSVC